MTENLQDLLTLFWVDFRLAFLAIGGAAGVLPEVFREYVNVHGWLTEQEFVQSYAIGQLAPGPNMLMMIFLGYRLMGLPGLLVAFFAFFVPTAVLSVMISRWWYRHSASPWFVAVRKGLGPVAIGLLISGLATIGQAAITDVKTGILAVIAGGLVLTGRVNPAVAMLVTGIVGVALLSL